MEINNESFDNLINAVNQMQSQLNEFMGFNCSYTIDSYCIEWYENYKKPNWDISTNDRYYGIIKNYIIPLFKDIPLNTRNTLIFQQKLITIKAPNTREKCKSILWELFQHAYNRRIITFNPISSVQLPKHNKDGGDALSNKELKVFINCCLSPKYVEFGVLFVFLAFTGLRIGEALALQKSDFDSRYIHITKTLYQKQINTPKTNASTRDVPIFNDCKKLLKQYKLLNCKDSDFIFSKGLSTYERKFKLIIQECNNFYNDKKYCVHSLRKTFASRLIQSKVDLKYVQQLLGHEDSKMTLDIYYKLNDDYLSQQNKIINKGVKFL